MAYTCFWVQTDCVRPDQFTCRGCAQYPYGEEQVAPPGAAADFAQQLMGVHIGMAEVLAKKGIAKPEELDEAIARTIEQLANQDRMLRDAVCEVEGIIDAMIRVTEAGKLDVYVALENEDDEGQQDMANAVIKSLEDMVPPGTDIRVVVAPQRQEAGAEAGGKPAAKKPAPKKPRAKKSGNGED